MGITDGWDIVLWLVVGYLAIRSLVRLMLQHRDQLVARFRGELEQERQRQKQIERERKRQESQKNRRPPRDTAA